MKKIISLIKVIKRFGLNGVLYYVLKNINFKYSNQLYEKYFDSPELMVARKKIKEKLIKISNKKIISGHYKNTILTDEESVHISSQLLGTYEQQVQEKIIELQKKNGLLYFVNYGAGNGFHAIGSIGRFKKAYCYELDSNVKEKLIKNIFSNSLEKKVLVFDEANLEHTLSLLNDKLSKTLFCIDIEGGEFKIFNNKNIKFFKKSFFIIENHENFYKKKQDVKKTIKILKKNFHLYYMDNGPRDPIKIKELKNLIEDEKWLAVSEIRKIMNWIILEPK